MHLIPEGYVGNVVIVFGAPDGSPREYDGNTRVYRIPKNGILRTQFSTNPGWFNSCTQRFYDVSATAALHEITGRTYSTVHDTRENREDIERGIHLQSNGTTAAPVGPGRWSSESPCAVKYEEYFVGSKEDLLEHRDWIDVGRYLEQHPVPCREGV